MEHIFLLFASTESSADYHNRKGFYSITMQSLVDFQGLFMDVYIGWPGKVHDARPPPLFIARVWRALCYLAGLN